MKERAAFQYLLEPLEAEKVKQQIQLGKELLYTCSRKQTNKNVRKGTVV